MSRDNHYGGLIFTHHALQRLEERQFSQHMVVETFHRPDSRHSAKQAGAYEYRKQYDQSTVTVIAKQNDRSEWVVLSCWIDPPLPGTKDWKQKQNWKAYQRAGFWGKVWITIKQQLGL
jgi:hypothetical protein